MGFHEGKLSAHHIGAARPDHGRRYACFDGVVKGGVHRIDGIYSPQPGGDRIHIFIAVVPLHPFLFLRDPHMAMRLNDPRHHQISSGVDHLHPLPVTQKRRITVLHPANRRYLTVLDLQETVLVIQRHHKIG